MILFCADDTGPALNLAILINGMKGARYAVYAGSVAHDVFRSNGIKSSLVERPYRASQIDAIFQEVKPILVVTGTSWCDALEKHVLLSACKKGIRTIAIIEHWSWYSDRFVLEGRKILPDSIIVNDLIAKEEAVDNGLPAGRIYPLGNLVLEHLAGGEIRTMPEEKWRETLGLPEKDIVTFVSEDYAKDNFMKPSACHGFDEYEAIEDIIDAAGRNYHIIIKLHPAEDKDKYDKLRNKNISVIGKVDKGPLIAYSKLFIGMGSILLLEAALHRRDVISYRPRENRGFVGNKLGVTCLVKERKGLEEIFAGRKSVSNRVFGDNFKGSFERIGNFIRKNIG